MIWAICSTTLRRCHLALLAGSQNHKLTQPWAKTTPRYPNLYFLWVKHLSLWLTQVCMLICYSINVIFYTTSVCSILFIFKGSKQGSCASSEVTEASIPSFLWCPLVTFLVLGYDTPTEAMHKRKNLFGAYGVRGSESTVTMVRSTVTDKQTWCWRGRELTSWDTTARQRKLSGMKKSSVFDPSPWNGPPSFRVSPPTLVNQI